MHYSAAEAAVTHEYIPTLSSVISSGVPANSGEPSIGALGLINSATVAGGRLFLGEELGGATPSRVTTFDDSSGAFQSPELLSGGQLTEIGRSVAVTANAEEQLYTTAVREGGERLVAEFGAPSEGKRPLRHLWTGATTANKSFTVSGGVGVGNVIGVAVNEDRSVLSDWASGAVFVVTRPLLQFADTGEFTSYSVVDVFRSDPEGAEPGEVAAEIHGTCAGPGTCPGEEISFAGPEAVAVSAVNGEVYVVDGAHVIDVFAPVGLNEFAFVRQITGTPSAPFTALRSITVDGGTGDLYVVDNQSVVDQFDEAGEYLGHITGSALAAFTHVGGVAVDPVSHDVFVGSYNAAENRGQVGAFGPSVTVPDVSTGAATGVARTSVTLNGMVNPAGAGPAECSFEWGVTPAFGHTAKCDAPVANGSEPVAVKAVVGSADGLQPGTHYFYRLQASNANGTNEGEALDNHEFLTLGPSVRSESVSAIGATSATLEASINPNGQSTGYFFEYGPTSAYGAVSASGSVGPGSEDLAVSEHVQSALIPGTLYHYRVVAVSEGEPLGGPDETFTTQAVGAGFRLPDGREWEQVSPSDKKGAGIAQRGESMNRAAASGSGMAYEATAATEPEPAGEANIVSVLSTRLPGGGWVSHDIASQHESVTGVGAGEYDFFSTDLGEAVLQPTGAFSRFLSPEASEQTAFLRMNFVSGEAARVCTEGCYEPLVAGCPAVGECVPAVQEAANVPPGTQFGQEGECPSKGPICGPEFLGGSADLKHIVLRSDVPLSAGAAGSALYEWTEGRLAPISLLPDGSPPPQDAVLGGLQGRILQNAVSSDGRRIFWSESGFKAHLYMRLNPMQPQSALGPKDECLVAADACTIQLDAVQGGAGGGQPEAVFQFASSDGSRVFFTDGQPLTADAGRERNLYECTIDVASGPPACHLQDLTAPKVTTEPSAVRDLVVGGSEDGSWVYFVSDGNFTPNAINGDCTEQVPVPPGESACNLYTWHNGVTKLVTVLSAGDYPDWNGQESAFSLTAVTARVSPNGRWLAFMSQRPLTGYDNRDLVTGARDEEVYLYDANSEKLVCASCDPSGGRPKGIAYGEMTQNSIGEGIWPSHQGLAGGLPAWTAFGGEPRTPYQPRFLSDGGRLFFDSVVGLVSEDANKAGDVYEFEPEGQGGCASGVSSGSVVFVPERVVGVGGEERGTLAGCVGLISGGSGPEESNFFEASESGDDVFFLTTSSLSSSDTDSSADLYDAHVCGVSAPCGGKPAAPPAPCDSEGACRGAPGSTPESGVGIGTETSSGPGNVSSSAKESPKLTPLEEALKRCRAKHGGARRTCERSARRHFALIACHARKGKRRRRCEETARARYSVVARRGSTGGSRMGGRS